MLKRILAVLAILAAAVLVACGSDDEGGGTASDGRRRGAGEGQGRRDPARRGVLGALGDTGPEVLGEAFKAAGVESDIQNANGDKAKFATIADQMINGGVTVLLIVNLDSPSAATVIKKAADQGIPTIDYDRLTLGGSADYYVSFDNVAVGHEHRRGPREVHAGERRRLGPGALLNGSPTDNNATLFKQGYETAITDAGYEVVADQAVPDWDNTKAGTIFEQMYTKVGGELVGVAAANDGLGGAVAAVLKRNGDTEKVPTTGQDATAEGLQRVLLARSASPSTRRSRSRPTRPPSWRSR
jgi:D-xylose transport system substrate-binding protein